jgi:hypothetical protein
MPSIAVSGQGHSALGFSVAGAAAYINAATIGRLSGDTLGTTQGVPVLYTASTTAYNPFFDPGSTTGRRWGDYSYTSLDPNDDMTLWTIQEFCDDTDSYGVRVAKLVAPPPATPDCTIPAPVTMPTQNVTIDGISTSGLGFFDPGSGFLNGQQRDLQQPDVRHVERHRDHQWSQERDLYESGQPERRREQLHQRGHRGDRL